MTTAGDSTRDEVAGSELEMTIVVLTLDDYRGISYLMDHLSIQTDRHRCELILLCPDKSSFNPDMDKCQGFASVRIEEVGHFDIRGEALAKGVRLAAAPVVALTEDHSFPQPGWISALLEAHKEPWAAVSATLENANPDSPMSWADLITGHGAITAPQTTGPRDRLGGHNVSYKRDVLLNVFGHDLGNMLDTEPIHHAMLVEKGYKLCVSGEAITRHTNFETWRGLLGSQYYHGLVYGSMRWKSWSTIERLKFLLGAPASPFIRIVRMLKERHNPNGQFHRTPRLIPILLPSITVGVVGEVLGCIFGPGKAMSRLTPLEFKRYRFFDKKFHSGTSGYTD